MVGWLVTKRNYSRCRLMTGCISITLDVLKKIPSRSRCFYDVFQEKCFYWIFKRQLSAESTSRMIMNIKTVTMYIKKMTLWNSIDVLLGKHLSSNEFYLGFFLSNDANEGLSALQFFALFINYPIFWLKDLNENSDKTSNFSPIHCNLF